jgi:hydroxypyruvate isomerase
MPRIAANLSMLFTEVPFLERFALAAQAGFDAVEVQFPYEASAEVVRDRLRAAGQVMVLHNLPAGDWAAGERGMACHPGREAEFREGVARAVHYATTLGVPRLNCLSGLRPAGVDDATLRRTFVANLRHAVAELKAAGLVLLIEPINPLDVPGFWLNRPSLGFDIVEEVEADNLFVQYDLYHAQRTEGELCGTLERRLAQIGHLQIADTPGRHEPGTGEIAWGFVFDHLRRIGYAGDIGAEYLPAGRTADGLAWLADARRRLQG